MNLEGASIIGGVREGAKGEPFRAMNPATGQALEPVYRSAEAGDVERAVALAAEASGTYGRAPGRVRGALLRSIATGFEAAGGEIIARAQLETALPQGRLQSELGRTCGQLRLFADVAEQGSWVDARIDHGDATRTPLPRPDVRSMLRPLGPVVVFGASNFPLAFSVAGGDTASALAAGCPVIVKAHPSHPGTSELAGLVIAEALRTCGLPSGVFALLFDAAHAVGLDLVRHPGVRAVAFTGSRQGGLALADAVRSRREPIPVYAEMGSINPVFLISGALRERADEIAAGLAASVTQGVGQFCTNPGLVIAPRSDSARLIDELAKRISAAAPAAMLNAGICETWHRGIDRLSRTPGVTRIAGVETDRSPGAFAGAALFSVDAGAFVSNDELMEERFGPSTLIVLCDSDEQMIEVARRLEGQLTSTIHAGDGDAGLRRALSLVVEQKAGRILFEGFPTGVEVCHAMVHGGPFPATFDGRSTSVGTRAIERFARAVAWQSAPDELLPEELREANPLGIRRLVDGRIELPGAGTAES